MMKSNFKRLLAALLAVFIFIGTASCVFAAGQPSSYSTSANSGQRDVVCTTLDGTRAGNYYTGSYTYDNLSELSSSALLSSLRTLLKSTHKNTTSYSDCKNYAESTDCENGNDGKLVTLYTSYTTSYTGSINREHVWPKSLGGYNTSGPGADLHHIRPTESTPNSNRGNLKYGEASGGKTSYGNASGYEAGSYGSYFEPLDNVKGDVARICLYMYVRYGGDSQYTCSSITKVFQSVDVLLDWCELDPVDTWEMGRNEVVAKIQGNRNVFIDYPEYAWLLFGYDVPDNMTTPSGEAMGSSTGGNGSGDNTGGSGSGSGGNTGNGGGTGNISCTHAHTSLVGVVAAGCTSNGYTGDVVCSDCGVTVTRGNTVSAKGHSFGAWGVSGDSGKQERTCTVCGKVEQRQISSSMCSHEHTETRGAYHSPTELGYSGDVYCVNCDKLLVMGTEMFPEDHTFGEAEILTAPTDTENGLGQRVCTFCGEAEIFFIEPLGASQEQEPNDGTDNDNVSVVIIVAIGGGSAACIGLGIWLLILKRKMI